MKFFFGATGSHLTYARLLANRLGKLDLDFEIYNFGELPTGKRFHIPFTQGEGSKKGKSIYYPKIPLKQLVVLDMMYSNPKDELLIYLDVDTLVNTPIPEIDTDDYDIGITIHPKKIHGKGYGVEAFPEKTSYLNAGVIFFRNNDKAKEFVRLWMNNSMFHSDNHSDQEGLTFTVKDYDLQEGQVVDIEGVRVKCFPSYLYNNCWRQPEVEGIKIRHAAGFREGGVPYLRKNILSGEYK